MSWLLETLVWTAALIALVLVLRRPVARHFGPKAAYALWLLPFVRLLLPPVVLPAWLAPSPAADVPVARSAEATPDIVYLIADRTAALDGTGPVEAASPTFPWAAALLALWLTGAALFLWIRFSGYHRTRRMLLESALPVGEAGRVRLVETAGTTAPIAFGVLDKVVALPPGFMAQRDRASRNLALAHELAHHRGHDLLANFAAQLLFALHWFNPLAYAGWQAMRRDQEAACDARVVESIGRDTRAAYGRVIASFAAGPKLAPELALAAPMACPVLGDKSIIHRLRSLTMTDITPRRRLAGRAILAAGLFALPLTASVSYAESVAAPQAPQAPLPPAALEAPAAPTAPPPPAAPDAPSAPVPPVAPEAPGAVAIERIERTGDGVERRIIVNRRESNTHDRDAIVEEKRRTVRHLSELTAEERAHYDRAMDKLASRMAELEHLDERIDREVRLALRSVPQPPRVPDVPDVPRVIEGCRGDEIVHESSEDGRQVIRICTAKINAEALAGLREARNDLAHDPDLSPEMRARVLRSLDSSIAGMAAKD
ncbi:M56 family metallopeptidase [Pelagerythrobacter sp.]|uniref:M56 family metallopeptidase n=1 Tax=Pelagerythrobacter sp. TaxID=2800702 RepID=UPI0035B189DF